MAADPSKVSDEETLWRLISPDWYRQDPTTGERSIDLAAFSHNREISALRKELVTREMVRGKFPRPGVAELPMREVLKAGCVVNIVGVNDWPEFSHVVIRRAPDGTRLRGAQIKALTDLANSRLLDPPQI